MITVTTTAVAFILLSFGLGFCGWRFYGAFQGGGGKSNSGFLVASYYFIYSLQASVLGFGSLFFAKYPDGLYWVTILSSIILAIITVYGVYILSCIFSWRNKFIFLFPSSLLALSQLFLTIYTSPKPYINESNSVVWNFSPLLSLFIFVSLAVSISVFFYIFMHIYVTAKNISTKILASFLAVSAVLGIIANFFYFILSTGSPFYEMTTAFIGLGTATLLLSIYLRTE